MNTWRQEEQVFQLLSLRILRMNQHYHKPLFTFRRDHCDNPIMTYLFLDSPPHWDGNNHFADVYLNTWRCLLMAKKIERKKTKILFPEFSFLSFSLAPPSHNVCQRVLVNIPSKYSGTNSLSRCSFLSPCGFSVAYVVPTLLIWCWLSLASDRLKPIETIQSHSKNS